MSIEYAPPWATSDVFPPHEFGLEVTFKNHLRAGLTAAEQIAEWDSTKEGPPWWSDYDKRVAMERNGIWVIRWCPETPGEWYWVASSAFSRAIDFAREVADVDPLRGDPVL